MRGRRQNDAARAFFRLITGSVIRIVDKIDKTEYFNMIFVYWDNLTMIHNAGLILFVKYDILFEI